MRCTLLLLALLLATPLTAAAQPTLRPGQTVTGELKEGDLEMESGVRYDVWRFRAPEEGSYLVNLRSDDFDAMLQVGSRPGEAGCEDCWEDDDGGEGLNARIVYPAQAGGRYLIRVLSFLPGHGSYSLELQRVPAATDTAVTSGDTTVVVIITDTVVTTTTTDTMMVMYDSALSYPALVAGEAVHGTLGDGDVYDDDGYFDSFAYEGSAGETVTITLQSDDFDTYLAVGQYAYDGRWEEAGSDDDGGEGTGSRLTMTFLAYDQYEVRVRGFDAGAQGAYTLLLESQGVDDSRLTTDTVVGMLQALRYGERVEGTLNEGDNATDGRYFDVYSFYGRAGETVTISLRSADFDAYLFIAAGWTGEKVVTDDDGGEGTDSEVTFTLPETGEYLIRATSLMPYEEGAYVLMAGPSYATDSVVVSSPQTLYVDEPVEGTLEEGDTEEEDGTLVDVWEYVVFEAETITVQMASDDFDTFLRVLVLRDDGGWDELGTDDDGGSGTNSELTLTLPRNGTYAIHAAALEAGTGGRYTLVVRRR